MTTNILICFQPESDHAVPIAPIIEHRSGQLLKIQEIDENLVSQYCVVKYDGKAFPGIILAVDQEDELEVKVMHRVGRNRFFWPTIEDTLWYAKENIITLLETPPMPVTARHMQVESQVWIEVEKEEY